MRILFSVIMLAVLAAGAAAQQRLQVGNDAPAFTAETLDGRQLDASMLEGKVVVLTFWSTRCLICHNEIPKLNQLAERYKGRDVVFLGLTMENNAKVEPYLKSNPFKFEIIPNSFGVVLKFADMDGGGRINMGFPAHFLIDRHGKIAHRTDGWDKAANLEAQISRLLAAE